VHTSVFISALNLERKCERCDTLSVTHPPSPNKKDPVIDNEEEAAALNSQQEVQMNRLRAQLNAAKSGLARIRDFMAEVEADQRSLYLIASTALQALQTCISFNRDMANSILEFRISCLNADEGGRSVVVARFPLGSNVTADTMASIRNLVFDACAKNPDVVRRLELEAADGEHFELLWKHTRHPATFFDLWELNDFQMKALMKALLESINCKSVCERARNELNKMLYYIYLLQLDEAGGFSVKALPIPKVLSPIALAVDRVRLGGDCKENIFLAPRVTPQVNNDVEAETWCDPESPFGRLCKYTEEPKSVLVGGTDGVGDYPEILSDNTGPLRFPSTEQYQRYCEAFYNDRKDAIEWSKTAGDSILNALPRLASASSTAKVTVGFHSAYAGIVAERLSEMLRDPKSDLQAFKDAVSKQNFDILAQSAQSASRVSMLLELLERGVYLEKQPGGDEQKAGTLEDILNVLKLGHDDRISDEGGDTKREMTDADAFKFLLTKFKIDELDMIVELYETLRFSEMVWLPQRDASLGKTLCKAEDFFHKLKRVMSAVRNQKKKKKKGAQPAVDTHGLPLFDREVLLEVANKQPDKFQLVIAAITGLDNDSMDPATQKQMFIDEEFLLAVEEHGKDDMSWFLRIIGEWFTAQDKSSISQKERERRLQAFRELFRCAFKNLWWSATKPPANVAGLPLRLWFSLAANVDSLHVLLNVKMAPQDIRRHPTEIQKRSRLFQKLSSGLIKLRYCGTYDLEGGFSVLVMLVGFKPACRIAIGVLRKAGILAAIRLNASRGFHMKLSRRSHYAHNVPMSLQKRMAVDEWFGAMGFVTETKRDVERKRTNMKFRSLMGRDFAKKIAGK
jgi:hypothetical protein